MSLEKSLCLKKFQSPAFDFFEKRPKIEQELSNKKYQQ